MRHRVAGRRFDRPSGPRRAMFRILVTDLIRHGRITTTAAKAMETRGIAEKVITLGKDGSLHARRRAATVVMDKQVLKDIFGELAERYRNRRGGYTRTLKLGPRKGDGAEMAILELVK